MFFVAAAAVAVAVVVVAAVVAGSQSGGEFLPVVCLDEFLGPFDPKKIQTEG